MSYHSLIYHIILRTAWSKRSISEQYERELYTYLYTFLTNKGGHVYRIGGMPEHIHILVSLPPSVCVSALVGEMKRCSHLFLKSERHKFPAFDGWSKSFGVFSHAFYEREKIVNYIRNQKEHHKRVSFEEELRTIFMEVGIEYKEDYFLKD